MANFAAVNRALRAAYPKLDIEAVRGESYVYFGGNDGLDKISSIYVHPSSIKTAEMIQIVLEAISHKQETSDMSDLDDLFDLHAAEQSMQAEREDKEKAQKFAALSKEEQAKILAEREAKAAGLCDGADVTRYNDDDGEDDEVQN